MECNTAGNNRLRFPSAPSAVVDNWLCDARRCTFRIWSQRRPDHPDGRKRLPILCRKGRATAALSGVQFFRLLTREFSARGRSASGRLLAAECAPSSAGPGSACSAAILGIRTALVSVVPHHGGLDTDTAALRGSLWTDSHRMNAPGSGVDRLLSRGPVN